MTTCVYCGASIKKPLKGQCPLCTPDKIRAHQALVTTRLDQEIEQYNIKYFEDKQQIQDLLSNALGKTIASIKVEQGKHREFVLILYFSDGSYLSLNSNDDLYCMFDTTTRMWSETYVEGNIRIPNTNEHLTWIDGTFILGAVSSNG